MATNPPDPPDDRLKKMAELRLTKSHGDALRAESPTLPRSKGSKRRAIRSAISSVWHRIRRRPRGGETQMLAADGRGRRSQQGSRQGSRQSIRQGSRQDDRRGRGRKTGRGGGRGRGRGGQEAGGGSLHVRNRHRSGYDLARLSASYSPLAPHVVNRGGYEVEGEPGRSLTVNFADPAAVDALNAALLCVDYGVKGSLSPPNGHLVPAIPVSRVRQPLPEALRPYLPPSMPRYE